VAKQRLPATAFALVKCPDCSNEQPIFVKAASVVTCLICGSTLATPSGGQAQIKAEVVKAVE
jgi:small subunit ribosomal protein S27e